MRFPKEIIVGPSYVTEVFDSELFELAFGISEEQITHYCSIEAGYVNMRTDCATAVAERRQRKLAELAAGDTKETIAERARMALDYLNRERKSA